MLNDRLARLLPGIFFVSGAAGLGYQMIWSRMFSTGMGHEMVAVLAVIAAFMGGLGLGSWLLDGPIARSTNPGLWYAGLEFVIGAWGLISASLIGFANNEVIQWVGTSSSATIHAAAAFALAAVVLLPATAAMGATLPAMERFVARIKQEDRHVGAVYAANTLGAVCGIIVTTFLLAPAFGLRAASWTLATANFLCGILALFAARKTMRSLNQRRTRSDAPYPITARVKVTGELLSTRRLRITLVTTGFLGIAYEGAVVRVLSQVLENTIYSYAAALSVYLVGTGVGAVLYQRFGRRFLPSTLHNNLLGLLSLACLLGIFGLAHADRFYNWVRVEHGTGIARAFLTEAASAMTVFGLPTILMGALFTHLVQQTRGLHGGIGTAAAINTFGGALAAIFLAVIFLPLAGTKVTLIVIGLGYLALINQFRDWNTLRIVVPGLVALTLWPLNLQIIDVPPGGRVAAYREGVMAAVTVIQEETGHRVLRVNNRFQMGGTAAARAEAKHAHIPLLLHPRPRQALFLGLGTGITLGAATLHPDLQIDGVELLPEIVALLPHFAPENRQAASQPQVKIFTADARRFVRATTKSYDVIVADLFHPARDGAGALYTVEHFGTVRDRLAAQGLFCQWLPLFQIDTETLRVIVRSFLEVFPNARTYLLQPNVDVPVVGLIGSQEPLTYPIDWVEQRSINGTLGAELRDAALTDTIRLFGLLVNGPDELREFANGAAMNTDDLPVITFNAPQFVYSRRDEVVASLQALLRLVPASPLAATGLRSDPASASFENRLRNYWSARNVYLAGLIEDGRGNRTAAVAAYLDSARLSGDFTPGYAQCLTIASVLARSNPGAARALLQELDQAQPNRPVAREMLRRLTETPGSVR